MSKQSVIVIGRQFGSGGREIGQRLAEKLGVPLYDKEVLAQAAGKAGLSPDLFHDLDETKTKRVLHSLSGAMGAPTPYHQYGNDDPSILNSDKAYNWLLLTIKELAAQGSCVFVGRCADHILRDDPNLISLFLYAPTEDRVRRICRLRSLGEGEARELIAKTDKARAEYYNHYTGKVWGAVDNYDLCVNSSTLGIEGTVELLSAYIEQASK